VGKGRNEFMPRRSIWKGSFVDAFLLRMKKKRDLLLNRKIWSRRSSILPEFVDCSVRIYNGKTPVRCKITEEKVGHKFGEFASTRKRRLSRTNIGPGRKRGKK
jgi:small subunit ribosomal protein S19